MAWSGSKIFLPFLTDKFNNTTLMDLNTDAALKVALYDNSITPDQNAAAASTAYNAGVWAAGHVFDASGWPSVGRDLVGVASGFAASVYTFDANDLASANNATTLIAVFGCQVYDDTITTPVADQGICYNYFGGTQSVTSGTFTIVWGGTGILALTL